MIGNDVVDIIQSRKEGNWQREGFIQKIFTHKEKLLITQATEPEIMVWLLWSMKEAAYKIYNRQTKIREYIPKKLQCTLLSQNHDYILGQVLCLENIYYTKTILNKDEIYTIAVSNLHDFDQVVEIEKKDITKDKHGIPYLKSDIFQDVSVSNHGRFEKVVTLNY